MKDEPNDIDLVRRHLDGDRRAFEQIVETHERRVYAVALRMLSNPEDARDVTQEVFVTALRTLPTFQAASKLSTWLYRIAVNRSVDVLRRRQRRETRPLDEEAAERPSREPGPEEAAVEADRAAAVRSALAALSSEHRAVVALYDLEGLDYQEIAEALDIPIGTVKSRIHRARVELARALGHLRETELPAPAGRPKDTGRGAPSPVSSPDREDQ